MNSFQRLWLFFTDRWSSLWESDDECKKYKEAEEWAECEPDPLDAEAAERIREHAESRYADRIQVEERIDAKIDTLLRFNAGLAAGLFALVKLARAGCEPAGLSPSFGFFLGAIAVLLFARASVLGHTRPSISSVVDGLGKVEPEQQDVWIARSLHVAVVGMTVSGDRKARRIDFAILLTLIGVLLLPWTL